MRSSCLLILAILALGPALAACGTTIRAGDAEPDEVAYSEILARHVDENGRVDYEGLAADRDRLRAAYSALAVVDPATLPDDEARLAYWIDAYNLGVLVGVDELKPDGSVMDVRSPVPFTPEGAGFFYFTKFEAGGETMSLHHLENEVIRKRFEDPRIHFAINCASGSCPPLEATPWQGSDLDARLDEATRRFVADPDQVRIRPEERAIELNPIFDWFREDFGDLYEFLIRYAAGERGESLRRARDEEWPITFFAYDWSLNDRPAQKR